MRRNLLYCIVFLLAVVLCIVVVIVHRSYQSTGDTHEASPENAKVTGDVSDVASIKIDTVPKPLDYDPEKTGIVLYITFYDVHGSSIEFENTEYKIRIRIFEAVAESSSGTMVKGKLLHDFCCPPITKTSSYEMSSSEGVEIYLNLSEPTWGIVEVEVEISGVGTFYAVGEAVEFL